MSIYKCLACQHLGTNGSICVNCGASCVILESDKPAVHEPRSPARGLAGVPKRKFVRVKATLAQAVGGKIPTCGLILVTGPAGKGKSTLVAELGIELERANHTMVVLDAEMGDELAAELWTRAGASRAERAKLRRINGEETEWSAALEEAERQHASVIVIDSINEWGNLAGREVVLADIRRNGPLATRLLVIAIAHYARAGHLLGGVSADHRCDALITVEAERIWQEKCTWHGPDEIARE